MPTLSALSRIPMLRLLVPLATGIFLDRVWHVLWAPVVLLGLAIALYVLLIVNSKQPQSRQRLRPWFILPLSFAALSLGWIAAFIHCPPRLSPAQSDGRVLTGRVANLDYTDFSMRLMIDVLDPDLPSCKVMVSTRGCDYTMRTGDLVAWPAHLEEMGDMGNPGEMDYATYLLDTHSIRYHQHLPLTQVKRIGHHPTLQTRMDENRSRLKLMVFNSQLSPVSQAFVTALVLGDSSFIDKATRQEFAAAGIAHVLALSGLHVGIIALIIWWLLFPLDYMGLRKVRLVLTLCAIVLFTLFTGMSHSAVRATVMTGMAFASFILYRRSVALNALALAALLILVFSPSSLYNVGFQLSFVSVAALLVFTRLPRSLEIGLGGWTGRLTSAGLASLVAMLATMALTAYYFHTVSALSMLTNLLVLPVLPVLMVLGALFLLVTAAGMQWPALDWAIDTLYRYIHGVATAVGRIPMGHFQGVYVSMWGVLASFVIMALIAAWLYRRRYAYLLGAGIVLVLALAHSLWIDAQTPKRGVIIFNAFSSTPILYYNDGMGYVWTPDDEETDSTAFFQYYAGFLARHRISRLSFVSAGDTLNLNDAWIRPPYALLMGRRLMAVGSGPWRHMKAAQRLTLDDIVVTKRYHGTAATLQRLYDFQRLILSGGHYDISPLRHECDSLGIAYYDLGKGALNFIETEKANDTSDNQ